MALGRAIQDSAKAAAQLEKANRFALEKATHQRQLIVASTVIGLGILSFVIPWGGVRATVWVVEEFRQEEQKTG